MEHRMSSTMVFLSEECSVLSQWGVSALSRVGDSYPLQSGRQFIKSIKERELAHALAERGGSHALEVHGESMGALMHLKCMVSLMSHT